MSAPAGAFSIFLHCRSSDRSRRSSICIPHCRSCVCSRRSLFYIPPLPQQCLLPQEPFLYSFTAAAVTAAAGALSVFPHCRSSDCSRRSSICISTTAAAVSAPAGAFSIFPPLPQQCLLPQEPVSPPPSHLYFLDSAEVPLPQAVSSIPSALSYANFGGFTGPLWLLPQELYLYFHTAAAVSAPAGAFSIFPHCRSSVCSRRSLFSISLHCRSSDRSRRSSICISPLPQQYLLPQEPFLYFPTAAAVTAPAGALSVFPHCRSSDCSRRSSICISPLPQQCLLPQEPFLYSSTAAAVTAPAGALSVFPHCRSCVCSRRSLFYIPPLPQQCLLPQEPFLYSFTAAAVTAAAGALSVFPHCRSSDCSRRSSICISTLPQQWSAPAGAFSIFPPLPQQCLLPQEPVSPPPSHLYFLDSAEVPLPQAVSSIPSALSYANFGGFTGPLWLLSRDNSVLGEHSGSGLHAELGLLSPVGGSTPGSGIITELGALSSDSTPNMHNPLLSLLYVSVNS